MIRHIDAIHLLKELPDNSIDLIFTDPPYALGSEVIIREDGKPDYKKAIDFMNKWDQPNGKFWEECFNEANRVLKYGGRVLMFGMDRQLMLNKYYGTFAGSGSIPIAAKLLGFEVIVGDLDECFVEIANARLDYAIKHPIDVVKIVGGKLNKIDINKNKHDFF